MEIEQEKTQQPMKRKSSIVTNPKEMKTKDKKKQTKYHQQPKRQSLFLSPVTIEDIKYVKNDEETKTKEPIAGVLTFRVEEFIFTMCPNCLRCWKSNNVYKHVKNYISVCDR